MSDPRMIKFDRYRCFECGGWSHGDPHAYVNGSGWCKWCVTQIEHPFGWMIPPRIDTPLGLVVWGPLIAFPLTALMFMMMLS